MTTLAPSSFTVQAINSNHAGSEFGVIRFEPGLAQPSLDECLALLAQDGWSDAEKTSSTQAGASTFLVSRRK